MRVASLGRKLCHRSVSPSHPPRARRDSWQPVRLLYPRAGLTLHRQRRPNLHCPRPTRVRDDQQGRVEEN